MQMKKFLMTLLCVLLSATTALAQNNVTGTVVDEAGEPVIGASVMVKGTKTGTVTDVDGKFSLNNVQGKTIVVSYIGYDNKEVRAQNGMKIQLNSNSQALDEVVVTGMQKVDKRLFTGSSTKINAADAKIDGMADISRSLEGRAAGVSVQNVSGTFGTAPKIRVRGATSIYGNSKPLWVVDGVIMEDVTDVSADDLSSGDANTLISSAIAGLNSDDIETFEDYNDCMEIVAAYANSLPKWLLLGHSSNEANCLKVILQSEDDSMMDLIRKNPYMSLYVPPAMMDEPCPCGSGLSYRLCHGRNLS